MRGGRTVAMAFDEKNPKPIDLTKMKSSETTSFAQ